MRFTITSLSRCAGGNHVHMGITFGTGRTAELTLTDEELRQLATSDDRDELRERMLLRMASAIKEANATTATQVRTALLNKSFEV